MSIFELHPEPQLSLEERVARGTVAARLLNDPVVMGILGEVERNMLRDWLAGGSVEERERAWATIHALEGIRGEFRRIIAQGEHAAEALRRAQ